MILTVWDAVSHLTASTLTATKIRIRNCQGSGGYVVQFTALWRTKLGGAYSRSLMKHLLFRHSFMAVRRESSETRRKGGFRLQKWSSWKLFRRIEEIREELGIISECLNETTRDYRRRRCEHLNGISPNWLPVAAIG